MHSKRILTILIIIIPAAMARMQAAQTTRIPAIGTQKNFDAKDPVALQRFLLGGWYLPDGHYLILKEGGRATIGQLYKTPAQPATWRADSTTSIVYTPLATGTAVSLPIGFVGKSTMILLGSDGQLDINRLNYTRDDGTPFVRLRGTWRLNGETPEHYYQYSFSVPEFMQIGEYRGGQFMSGEAHNTAYAPDRVSIAGDKVTGLSQDFEVRIVGKTLELKPGIGQTRHLVRCIPNQSGGCLAAPSP